MVNHNSMAKLKSIFTYLIFGITLPLIWCPDALLSIRVWIIATGVIIVIATQPRMSPEEAKTHRTKDKYSFWWIYAMSILALLAPLLEWAYLNNTNTLYEWSFPLGVGLLSVGLLFRYWAIRTLGNHFTATVQIVPDHRIVDYGPYKLVRHPSYTGAYLCYLAAGILLEAWGGMLLAALAMGIAYTLRIQAEEDTLLRHFGAGYQNYAKRTKRLIPLLF